jgi:cystathionine gamma-lyase
VDMTAPGFEEALCAETAMVWVETPTNPTLKLVDLEAVAAAARAKNPGVLLVCDNTFASPMNQSPLAHGFDIVIHSTTKYLNGHSDALGGVAVAGTSALAERLRFLQNSVGAVMGPFDCYLVLRGIKTLGVRMARHNASGRRIAEWLQRQDMVERVVYPGLADHPQRHVYEKQMRGGTGMITFFIHGGLEAARAFLENVRVFALAESLGGVESLVDHPAIMTHASVPPEMRRELGITDTLIRLSVGVEDCDDLLGDLESALAAAGRVAGVRA